MKYKDDITGKRDALKSILCALVSTGAAGEEYSFEDAVERAVDVISSVADENGKIMLIGNGASASIASHIAVDLWKNGRVRAISFNDPALLTCIGNDCGYERVFEKPVEMFSLKEDLLIAISSSGQSENILKAVKAAKDKGAKAITLSGFKKDNPLRTMGEINFYVPAGEYGYVEVIHHFICHCFVDMLAKGKNG